LRLGSTHNGSYNGKHSQKGKEKKKTWAAGALSSMNGAARLINEASPTPTSLHKTKTKKKEGKK
jgi:hypothetical protein